MATITKTFTENWGSSYKSTWTITATGADYVASDATFTYPTPTVKAKYVGSNKGYAAAKIAFNIYIDTTRLTPSGSGVLWWIKASSTSNDDPIIENILTSWASNTEATLTSKNSVTSLNTSSFFKASNKTTRTLNITAQYLEYDLQYGIQLASAKSTTDSTYDNGYENSGNYMWGTIGTLTLNAPPQVTVGTPTYSAPHYAGLGTYSVPITSASAQYGGDIVSATLTVGGDSTTQTYSSSTITNQTLTVTPSVAGTYTPTLTITDSRGQTTTNNLTAITVNVYAAPSVNMDVFRSNSSGVKDDEGTYGLITADVSFTSAVATITQPVVTIDGTTTNNVTWYANYNLSTGVSSAISDWTTVDSGDTIYGLINGSFSGSQSYVIGITVTDSEGGSSAAIKQTLSTAFYTIDFQAGGKEIAFGGPSNDNLASYPDGLFKCDMDVVINGDANFNGDLTAEGDTSVQGMSVGGDISAVGNNTFATGNTEIENPYFSIDPTASPGTTDGDLYAAINTLGWTGDISSGLLTVKGLLTDILGLEGNLITIVTASDSGSSSSGTDKFWDIYAPTKDGVFLGLLHVSFASNTSGRRAIRCYTSIGGTRTFTNMIATIPPVSGAATEITIPVVIKLTSSQTFGVRTYQNGGSLNVTLHLEGVYIIP